MLQDSNWSTAQPNRFMKSLSDSFSCILMFCKVLMFCVILACGTQMVANKCLKDIMKRIDRLLRKPMKPRESRTMEVGRKNLAKQYVVSNVQCHQLPIVQKMVEWITRPIVHGELWHYEPFGRLVANYIRVERCGEHIIQLLVNSAEGGLLMGSGTINSFVCSGWKLGETSYFYWPNRAFKASKMCEDVCAHWSWGPNLALMVSDKRKPHYCPIFHFPLVELVALSE